MKRIMLLVVAVSLVQIAIAQSIFLHTNKQIYIAGEKIWLSAYLADSLSGKLLSSSHPLYLQLYAPDGKLKTTEIVYAAYGRGFGFVPLSKDLLGGTYRLRAFTLSMLQRNSIYEKRLVIQQPKEAFSIISNFSSTKQFLTSNPLQISLLPNKYIFDKREQVELLLQVKDKDGKPQIGTFSISVSDLRVANGQDANSILNQLITTAATSSKAEENQGITYRGRVINQKTQQPIADAELILMNLDSVQRFSRVLKTDSLGKFEIRDLVLLGTQQIQYQVNNKKGKPIAEAIIEWRDNIPNQVLQLIIDEKIEVSDEQKNQWVMNLQNPDGEKDIEWESTIALNEVEIKTNKPEELTTTGIIKLHTEANFKIDFDPDKPANMDLFDMIRQLPGVMVTGSGAEANVYIRGIGSFGGSNSPLFVLDGMAIGNITQVQGLVNPNHVIRIEVLSGANAAIYGSSAGNGVIAIYTRRFGKVDVSKINSQTKFTQLQGYQENNSFFNPNYSQSNSDKGADYRLTLYWNPQVITNEKGEAWLTFYTSDVSSNFLIMVQGATETQRGLATKMIRVK